MRRKLPDDYHGENREWNVRNGVDENSFNLLAAPNKTPARIMMMKKEDEFYVYQINTPRALLWLIFR